MSQLSYASTPVPADGQARKAAFLAAIFNNILAAHNDTDSTVAAAVSVGSVANAGKLWKVASDGSITAVGSSTFATLTATANMAVGGTLNVTGNFGVAGTATVTGLFTATGGVLGNVTGTATGLAAPISVSSALSDYKPATNASAGTITIGAGGQYIDSNGNAVGALGVQTVALPTQPTSTNTQWVGISLAPGTGAPVVTAAAVNAALSTLQLPTANKPVAIVFWRGATTLPSGIVAGADIGDVRNLGGSGSAGGGSGGAPTTAAYLINGTPPGSLSSAVDVTNSASGIRIHPTLIKADANSAGMDQILNDFVQRDTFSANRMTVSGGTVNILAASNNKWTVGAGGVTRQISATVSATVPGGTAAGAILFLIVDTSPSPPTLSLSTSNSGLSATQKILTAFVWDGATLARPDTGYLAAAMSTAVSLGERISATDTGVSTALTLTTSIQQFTNFNSTAFRLTEACILAGQLRIQFDATIAASDIAYICPLINGARVTTPGGGNRFIQKEVIATGTGINMDIPIFSAPLTPGTAYTLSAGSYRANTGTTTITPYANFCEVVVVPWRA